MTPSHEDVSRFIPPPPDEDISIWRYLDFTKFVALLDSRALFFVRVSQLEDPFEGSFPPQQTVLSRLLGAFADPSLPVADVVRIEAGLEKMWEVMRYWAAVSCWHASPHESAAMWRLYSATTNAVAIKSTVKRLRSAIGNAPALPPGFGGSDVVHIGMVEYIDFATGSIPNGSFAAQFFRKRKSFEHERELRAMVLQFPRSADGVSVNFAARPSDSGLLVPVNLAELISEVRIAPQAPAWYAALVKRVAAQYGLPLEPVQSELDSAPVF